MIGLIQDDFAWPLLSNSLLYHTPNYFSNSNGRVAHVYIPASLEENAQRMLSLDLGNGNCMWEPPADDVPNNLDFHKTAIVGYPSGDKRMIFVQMEALTGWPAKDEWDFQFLGITNHPFIKANYPHHEGIWGWGSMADQVVLMIKNMRESLVEYHGKIFKI